MKSNARIAWTVAAAFLTITATGLAQHGPGQQPQGQRPGAAQMQQNVDRGRMQDRDRTDQQQQQQQKMQDQQKAQDQQKMQDQARDMARDPQRNSDIYGSPLMTDQERNEYRERLAKAETNQEREKITAEHRAKMQARATEKGIDLGATGEPK